MIKEFEIGETNLRHRRKMDIEGASPVDTTAPAGSLNKTIMAAPEPSSSSSSKGPADS